MKQLEGGLRRRVLLFAVVAVLLFGIGYVIFQLMIAEKPQPVPPKNSELIEEEPELSLTPLVPPKSVLVVSTKGQVERMGFEKEWQAVSAGDHLLMDESIKTAKNASAKLKVDGKSEIDLYERSKLNVREISDTVHMFKLSRGKIGVDYDAAGARVIKIEQADSEAVAEAKAGKFTVLNTEGIVSVATTTGEVKLTTSKKSVSVGAGNTSRVVPGEPPQPARPIPVAVMLRVAKPKKSVQRQRFTVVRGRTDPGARVRVNEIPAPVAIDGRFSVRVPLREGRNKIVVVTEDVAGNTETRDLGVIIVDANAPIEDLKIRWKKRKGKPG